MAIFPSNCRNSIIILKFSRIVLIKGHQTIHRNQLHNMNFDSCLGFFLKFRSSKLIMVNPPPQYFYLMYLTNTRTLEFPEKMASMTDIKLIYLYLTISAILVIGIFSIENNWMRELQLLATMQRAFVFCKKRRKKY